MLNFARSACSNANWCKGLFADSQGHPIMDVSHFDQVHGYSKDVLDYRRSQNRIVGQVAAANSHFICQSRCQGEEFYLV